MGKVLIIIGAILMIAGILIHYAGRIPFFGKLPGDITLERENVKVYFPIMTSIVLSIILSLIIYLVNRFRQ